MLLSDMLILEFSGVLLLFGVESGMRELRSCLIGVSLDSKTFDVADDAFGTDKVRCDIFENEEEAAKLCGKISPFTETEKGWNIVFSDGEVASRCVNLVKLEIEDGVVEIFCC